MKRKAVSLLLILAIALGLGLSVPVVAAGPTFSDVPESYWGYADIEAVAEAGLMNGTGNGEFSPEMKVSVAQFLTLLGRLVFPETKVSEADSWFGPYVSAAQNSGLLAGTQVDTTNVEAEISRYDMAAILRAAAKKLGVTEKTAQGSEVTDYLDIPNRYTEAVLAVYGMGLIKGDQAGNFNGFNTMMRAEVATVIMRLAKAKPGSSMTDSDTTVAPGEEDALPEWEKSWINHIPVSTYDPDSVECVQGKYIMIDRSYSPPDAFVKSYVSLDVGETLQLTVEEVPAGYGYTKDNLYERVQYWISVMETEDRRHIENFSNGIWTSENPEIATVDQNGLVTVVGDGGQATIRVTVPKRYYGHIWTTTTDCITINTRGYLASLYEWENQMKQGLKEH